MKEHQGAFAELLLRRVVERSINSVKPATLFEESFRLSGSDLDVFGIPVDLGNYAKIRCAALGKSAEAMAFEVRKKLGDRVSGVVATPVPKHLGLEGFEFFRTGHPLPDNNSLKAGEAVGRLVSGAGKNELVLFLISGGGSASAFVPIEGVTLEEANRLLGLMFDEGVPIGKVNLVRRHLSRYGGGKLAALALGRKKISLVISDVVGDELSAIASGPTVRDETTPADALLLLEQRGLLPRVPISVWKALAKLPAARAQGNQEESIVRVIASNQIALRAAETAAIESGYNTSVLTRFWESDADEAARMLVSIARSVELDGAPVARPAFVLMGGETTVRLSGGGRGGRNQHLVLCALRELVGLDTKGVSLNHTTVFSFGTDGKDGNSDAAGAHASLSTVGRAEGNSGEIDDHITRFDSDSFFSRYGGLITTGPTDTNVMDIFGIIVA